MGNKRKMMGGASGRGLSAGQHLCGWGEGGNSLLRIQPSLPSLLPVGESLGSLGRRRRSSWPETAEATPRCHMSLMNPLTLGAPGMPSYLPPHPPDCTAP